MRGRWLRKWRKTPDRDPMPFLLILFLLLLGGMIWRGLHYSRQRLVLFELYCSIAILVLGVAPAGQYCLEQLIPPALVLNPMPISAGHYFGYALPLLAVICLAGLGWRHSQSTADASLLEQVVAQLKAQPYLPFLLLGLGILAQITMPWLPPALRQVGHFGSMLFYVGSVHLLFWPGPAGLKAGIFVGLAAYLVYLTLSSTFFGDLLFWPLWLVLYAQLYHRWSLRTLLLAGFVALGPVLFLLSFKYTYRAQIWDGGKHSFVHKLDAFQKAAQSQTQETLLSPSWQKVLIRLNQGDHLAQVYAWVPRHEPYACGETLLTAVTAALVPRLFWPNKPGAGGEKIWYRFTGNKLLVSSMNIGIGGEAYANFGSWLAPIFTFIWCRLLVLYYNFLVCMAKKYYPLLWLWVPLIYYPLVDQENDIITMLNHWVKGTFFTLTICFVLTKGSVFLRHLTNKLS